MNLYLDSPAALLAIYCLLALMAALVGGVMSTLVKLTRMRLQLAVVSFASSLRTCCRNCNSTLMIE